MLPAFFASSTLFLRKSISPPTIKKKMQLTAQDIFRWQLCKTRDCRVRRTPPTEASYKDYAKCLKKILSLVFMFPKKTLERELLYFVAKQLPFFIFPPARIRRNHQKHITRRAKQFQDGKWEDLWKQALHEYDIEIAHIQPIGI